MNTFLPYPNFIKSAKCLDYRRLGKQRVEAYQIYLSLTTDNYGWKNHPAVKMWKGCELALLFYAIVMCNEWIKRGYKDTLRTKLLKEANKRLNEKFVLPKWFGNTKFHTAMKSNLLRKDKQYYSKFGWKVRNNLPYIWEF